MDDAVRSVGKSSTCPGARSDERFLGIELSGLREDGVSCWMGHLAGPEVAVVGVVGLCDWCSGHEGGGRRDEDGTGG